VRERLQALVSAKEAGAASAPGSKRGDSKRTTVILLQNVPTLERLADRLRLSRFDKDVLLLCAAAALDARVGRLCAAANADGKPYPTFALAMRLFHDPAWEALAPQGGLRHWRLIEIHQTTAEPLISAALRADERIVNFLKGLNHIDDRVSNWIKPVAMPRRSLLPTSHAALCERIGSFLAAGAESIERPVVQLLGPHAAAKSLIASAVSHAAGRGLWRLSVASISEFGRELEEFARLIVRESILLDAHLLIDADAEEFASAGRTGQPLARFLDRADGVVAFLAVRDQCPETDRPNLTVSVGKPTAEEQRDAWLTALGSKHASTAGLLAGQFNLDFVDIARIAAQAKPQRKAGALDSALWREAREAVRPRISGLAERLEVKVGWDDLVLPPPQMELLKELAAQVRNQWTVYEGWGFARRMNRGLGIAAMFCGGSGTGKTMGAEVVARDVDLDLYRIDLASVVSKYIGETEKNLRRVFDAFEDGGAILFFDEADALFGKRSDVKDSHDRYANIEINYLLQRIEAYRGLAILATNRRSALDPAFLRRLRFIVEFPYPDAEARAEIWRRAFPPAALEEELDCERLSRLALSGGNIHAIALNAAFRAASENRRVGMDLVLASAGAEMTKLDLPINEADFRRPPELRRSA
jgi:hypothetical protein